MKLKNLNASEVEDLINKQSGLLGVSGLSNDARNVSEAAKQGNPRAQLAIKMLANSIKKYIGSYIAEMNGIDVLVFTAGIGENDDEMRSMVCSNMDVFDIKIDEEINSNIPRGSGADITAKGARVKTLVIPTNEEYMIAQDTAKFC